MQAQPQFPPAARGGGGDQAAATPPRVSSSSAAAGNGNVDRVLYRNLVEMVPLVESLMVGALRP